MKIHVLGKAGDNIAHRVANILGKEPEHDILHSKDTTELIYDDNIVVLDSCDNIGDVKVITNANDQYLKNNSSLYKTDLSHFMSITDGKKRVTIIGIPSKGKLENVTENVRDLLQQLQGSYVQKWDRLKPQSLRL